MLSAPHTGAQVGYSPLTAGGWDGFGRLLPGGAAPATTPVAGGRAACRRPRPRAGCGAAAGARRRSRAGGGRAGPCPGGDTRARWTRRSPPSWGALRPRRWCCARRWRQRGRPCPAEVRLVPVPEAAPAEPAAPPYRLAQRGPANAAGRRAPRVVGREPAGDGRPRRRARGGAAAPSGAAAVPLQAAAALTHLLAVRPDRAGSRSCPTPDLRDAVNLAGSVWDAASAAAATRSPRPSAGGAELTGAGLWAARFGVARRRHLDRPVRRAGAGRRGGRRDRIGYGLMAAGSATATVGLATAGGIAGGVLGGRRRRWCRRSG